jgi:transcriptional regulator with XRE-family HTH domain
MPPKAQAPELLRQHLAAKNLNQREFAELVPTSEANISRILAGEYTPGVELCLAIAVASKGDVPVQAWVPKKAAKKKRNRTAAA